MAGPARRVAGRGRRRRRRSRSGGLSAREHPRHRQEASRRRRQSSPATRLPAWHAGAAPPRTRLRRCCPGGDPDRAQRAARPASGAPRRGRPGASGCGGSPAWSVALRRRLASKRRAARVSGGAVDGLHGEALTPIVRKRSEPQARNGRPPLVSIGGARPAITSATTRAEPLATQPRSRGRRARQTPVRAAHRAPAGRREGIGRPPFRPGPGQPRRAPGTSRRGPCTAWPAHSGSWAARGRRARRCRRHGCRAG